MSDSINFGAFIERAARECFGEPNKRLSKPSDLRFGKNGSVSVNVAKGQYFDNETKTGGGCLDMIVAYRGGSKADAVEWLRQIGCDIPETRRGDSGPRSSAPRQRPRQDDEPPPWDGPPEGYAPPPAPMDDGRDAPRQTASGLPGSLKEAMRKGPSKVYPYVDENGHVLFEVCRFEFEEAGVRSKTFRQRRKPRAGDDPDKIKGGWVWSLDGVQQVPYRLPELLQAISAGKTVYIPEGEKDVETLQEWGFAATCNAAGSGKWPDELTHWLNGAKSVVLLQDNDKAGRNHTNVVGNALRSTVADLQVMDFADLPEKSDVTDFRDLHGGTADDFIDRAETRLKPWTPTLPASKFGAVRFIDIDDDGPETEYFVDGLLTTRDKSVIGGEPGSGKSFFASNLGYHVALGWPFLGRKVKQGLVCYQAGESARGMRRRMRAFRNEFGVDPGQDVPFVMLSKRIDLFTDPARGNQDVQNLIDEVRAWSNYYYEHPLRAVFIDTLARATVGAEENSAKDMGLVVENIERLSDALGCHVCAVHHMNANGDRLRGSGAVQGAMDTVLVVSVDKETKRRSMKIVKQKDDEDGTTIDFELKGVRLGTSETGRPITSCVVMPADWRDKADGFPSGEQAKGGERFRLRLRESEGVLFRALWEAVRDHGEMPPVELADRFSLPVDRRVVRWSHVRDVFRAKTDLENDDSIRKAMQRGGDSLLKRGIINRDNPFAWWTGQPVMDMPETYAKRRDTTGTETGTGGTADPDPFEGTPADDWLNKF